MKRRVRIFGALRVTRVNDKRHLTLDEGAEDRGAEAILKVLGRG